jgi:hypothetical protein
MKRKLRIAGFFLALTAAVPSRTKAQFVVTDVIKIVATKVINAIDLAVQQVQNKTIVLQNVEKELENMMSKLQLDDISNWVDKQRRLYEDYYNELWKVKQIIVHYDQVKEIIQLQAKMVSEYNRASALFEQDKHFTAEELDQMLQVYAGLLNESLKNIDQVFLVVNSQVTQMDDAARLAIIHQATNAVQKNYDDLQQYNHQNVQLSLQREKDLNDREIIKKLYAIP